MNTERDLLPWICAGVMLTILAVAVKVTLAATPPAATIERTTAPLSSAVLATPTPAPLMDHPPGAATVAPLAIAVNPSTPSNKIWECDVDGHRTFADSPCGAHASIREIGTVNIMASARPSSPDYASFAYPTAGGYAPDTRGDLPQSPDDVVYFANGVVRHGHSPKPHLHERGGHGARR